MKCTLHFFSLSKILYAVMWMDKCTNVCEQHLCIYIHVLGQRVLKNHCLICSTPDCQRRWAVHSGKSTSSGFNRTDWV